MNSKKSAGPDSLPIKIITEFACELSIPVVDVLNSLIREGYVPQIFKEATVTTTTFLNVVLKFKLVDCLNGISFNFA